MCLFQPTFYLVICLSYSCQNKNFHVLQLLDKQLNLLLSGSLMGCHIRCQWSYSQWVGPAWMVELTIDGFVWFDIKHFMPHCLCWIVLWNDNWNRNQGWAVFHVSLSESIAERSRASTYVLIVVRDPDSNPGEGRIIYLFINNNVDSTFTMSWKDRL